MSAWPGWEHDLVAALGEGPSNERAWFFRAWHLCEGGTARFNPLNTTLRLVGSTDYNAAGVQHYSDRLMGLAATLLTLRLSYYDDIRKALHEPRISAPRILAKSERAIRIWGTNPLCIAARLG